MSEVLPGVYRHFKGNRYEVLGIGRHSETGEELVVYRPLYMTDGPQLWVRPILMFAEEVEVDGVRQPRFSLIHVTDEDLRPVPDYIDGSI
jgi:hypothetical protein